MTKRAYIYFVLTFLLGAVLGAAATIYYGWHSGHWHQHFDKQRMLRHLQHELNLSPGQVQQVGQILDEFEKKITDLHHQVEPQFNALVEERRNRLRQVLNADQVQKFNELVRSSEERRKKLRGP